MKKYDVIRNGVNVGCVYVRKDNLYYEISCACRLEEGIHRLYARTDKGQVLVGVLFPCDGEYTICKKVCMKSLGLNIQGFFLIEEFEIRSVCGEKPFQGLKNIGKARFISTNGNGGIQFMEGASRM